MRAAQLVAMYRRFGPLLFSHFLGLVQDEGRAMKATRLAFESLVNLPHQDEAQTVRWIRAQQLPRDIDLTASAW